MNFARSTCLALWISGCASSTVVPPHTGGADSASAEPAAEVGSGVRVEPVLTETSVEDGAELSRGGFAGQRAVGRSADPMRPTPMGGAAVRLGAPYTPISDAPGVLRGRDPASVLAEVEYNGGYLQRCWESRAMVARSGTIVIHAHLDPDGMVGGQCVSDDPIGDAELLRCANDVIAMGRYPELADAPEDIVFTFHFDGGKS